MAEFDGERALLDSHYVLFNQLVRNKGQELLRDAEARIRQLEVNGAPRADATRLVIEDVLRENGGLDQLREDAKREFRRLLSQATAGTFQERMRFHAEPGEELVWVSILSSRTCTFKPSSSKYLFRGRPMVPTDFCANRHGMRGTEQIWDRQGRPRTGHTVCLCIADAGAIVTVRGGDRRIDEVLVGDQVLTHLGRFRPVTATPRVSYRGRLSVVGGVKCTPWHSWLTEAGWVRAEELETTGLRVHDKRHAMQVRGSSPERLRVGHLSDLPPLGLAESSRADPEGHGDSPPQRTTRGRPDREPGVAVQQRSRAPSPIERGGTKEEARTVYDLTVEDDHSYVVGGLISHNSNCECTLVPASFARQNPSVLEPVDLQEDEGS